jgi:hypothetical protein
MLPEISDDDALYAMLVERAGEPMEPWDEMNTDDEDETAE